MAVILGTKSIKDTYEYNDYAIGITFPIRIGKNAFEQSFTTYEQVKTNIKSLLLTKKGERIMQPHLGSGLTELNFDPNDDFFDSVLENTIIETLNRWLPYVNVEYIDVSTTNSARDKNTAEVSITFRIGNNIKNDTVTFNL